MAREVEFIAMNNKHVYLYEFNNDNTSRDLFVFKSDDTEHPFLSLITDFVTKLYAHSFKFITRNLKIARKGQ